MTIKQNERVLQASLTPKDVPAAHYPTLTREQALTVPYVHQNAKFDSTGACRGWRRNGITQTWKRNPSRFRLPLKYGMYAYDAITEASASLVHAPEDCPHATPEERESARRQRMQSIADSQRHAALQHAISTNQVRFNRDAGRWEDTTTGQPYHDTPEEVNAIR